MIDQLMALGWIGRPFVLLYVVPTIICLCWFAGEVIRDVRADLRIRKLWPATYCPSVCIGEVLVFVFSSMVPVLNIVIVVFGPMPALFNAAWRWFNEFISMPLVSDNNKGKDQ